MLRQNIKIICWFENFPPRVVFQCLASRRFKGLLCYYRLFANFFVLKYEYFVTLENVENFKTSV